MGLEQQGIALNQQEAEYQRFIQQAADQLKTLRHDQSLARTQEALFGQSQNRDAQGRGLAERLSDSKQTLQQIQQRQEECRLLWHSEIHCDWQTGESQSDSLDRRMADAGIGDSQTERARVILARLQTS
jgi:hypothetical protein